MPVKDLKLMRRFRGAEIRTDNKVEEAVSVRNLPDVLYKLEQELKRKYVVKFSATSDTFETSYADGEGSLNNGWREDSYSYNVDSLLSFVETFEKHLDTYISNKLYMDTKHKAVNTSIGYIQLDQMVNTDNFQASNSEISAWKKGEARLWVQYTNITVMINGQELSSDVLIMLLPKAEKF